MSGYTPMFSSLLDGTLYGRWPHTGIWACLLSQVDKRGHIDVVPQLLAAKIGVPIETLLGCIHDFMQPDPGSRSGDLDGRRLELIDVSRDWGWRVVNHGLYRERARKQAYDSDRTESGADAERKRKERAPAKSREVPTRPAKSRRVPLSDTDTDTDINPRVEARASRLPDDFALTELRRQIAEHEKVDPDRTFAKFVDYWRSASGANARKRDWDATWRNWCRTEGERKQPGHPYKTKFQLQTEALERASSQE